MKKSTKVTPKELSNRRIAKSTLMRIPNNEGKFSNNENENPQLNIKKKSYKIHDRKIKEDNLPNPFDIPDHKRLFSESACQRKTKPEPFIMSEPQTICDIDDTFFKVIEGRPLRQFADVKVYMRNIRDITLFRANAAYLNDQILQFEKAQTFEMEQYTQIDKLYEKTKINFVQFAKESYEKAKAIQRTAEVKAFEVAIISERLEAFSFEYVKLRNKLSSIVFSFETLTLYGKFLNSLGPDWWRAEFDYLNIGKSVANVHLSTTNRQSDVAAPSVASIDEFKTYLVEMPPRIYFKKPKQIMAIYDDLGRQCLNYMKLNVFAANIVNSVQKSRDFLKTAVKSEIDEMVDFIEIYERNVTFMEQRETDYKAVFEKLLYSEFQTLYASPENIKLFTCVQYVNTRVFDGPEDPKDSVLSLMHGLEMQFIELSSGMDRLDLETVKAATSHMYAEDIKMMKRAYLAQRTLKECDILSKALYTSFEPPKAWKRVKEPAKTSDKIEEKNK